MVLIALKAITGNLLVLLAVFGFGSWITRWLPESFSRFTRLVCALTGGFGLLGLTIFLVGHVALNRWTIGGVLAAGVALAIFNKAQPLRQALQVRVPVAKLPGAIVVAMLALTAVAGLAEPVGDWGKDGVAYHLVGPKVWLREGVIRPIADNSVTSYPATAEMVFTALRAFGGPRAPGFSAAWTMALLMAVAAALGRRCGIDVRGAWWIAALLITMPTVYNGGHSAFVDVIYATFILTAVRVGFDAVERKHFAAFGLFCGLALATKYPALLALPLLLICAMWKRGEWRGIRAALPNALLTALTAFVVASPFYLRNWIELGSPIYPAPWWVTKFAHVKYFTAQSLRDFYAYNRWRGRGHGGGILHFVSLPYNLTYHTADFNGAGGIGLAPLAFAPLGVWAAWREGFARRLALVGLMLLALWFITMQESRYLIHVYTLSAVFAVFGWQMAASITGRRGQLLCAAVVAISLAYGGFMIGNIQVWGALSVISPARGADWHRTHTVFVESFDWLNRNPDVKRLLILDRSVPAYYSDKDYVKPFGQWGEQVYPDVKSAADILPRLHELGITHVLDVESTIAGYQIAPGTPGLELVFEQAGQRVYKVIPLS